jgi:hypothetical protein
LIDLRGAGRMVAGAGTFAQLVRLGPGGAEISLERGSLLLHVTPRPAAEPFWVRTPRFSARVVGTVLRVAVRADGNASLQVGHGTVEVHPRGGSGTPVVVKSGERYPSTSQDVPLEAELERLGSVDLEGTRLQDFTPVTPAPPDRSLQDESALYEAGFRALHDRGDPRAALDIWELERSRFPQGALARDLRASIIDALVALGQSARALAEIEASLRAEPDGLRAPELRFVRATLLRATDGDCRRARSELARALEHPAEPWQRRARSLLERCQAESR